MRVKSKPQRWKVPSSLRRSDSEEEYDERKVQKPTAAVGNVSRDWRDVTKEEVDAAFSVTYKERKNGKSAGHSDATYQHKVTGSKVRSVREAKRYLAEGEKKKSDAEPSDIWFNLCSSSSSG